MHHLWDTTTWKVCDLDLTFKNVKGHKVNGHKVNGHKVNCHKVNWNIIYDFIYVLHANIGHSMHCFWDIGLHR